MWVAPFSTLTWADSQGALGDTRRAPQAQPSGAPRCHRLTFCGISHTCSAGVWLSCLQFHVLAFAAFVSTFLVLFLP